MSELACAVTKGDCLREMPKLAAGSVNLVVADPPYNLGRNYDVYDDKRSLSDYLAWAADWLGQIHRILQRHGSFWLIIGPSLVSELDVLCKRELKFYLQSHVIWTFGFGQNCPRSFTQAHTHLLHYTKTKTRFTFNADDPDVRVPSARQLIYNDKRANPKGRLPDDVWILRPGELKECFKGHADVWLESRICGTFKEREKGADNQMPLAIMDRIIRVSSNAGDLVCDPFLGTGTTAVSALQLGRSFVGWDVSAAYVKRAKERIAREVKRGRGSKPAA